MSDLHDRALRHGIQPSYQGMDGDIHHAPDATLHSLLAAFGPGADHLPVMQVRPGTRCHLPDDGRAWGVALQLYQLRSDRNWGIGDFADLADLAAVFGRAGADFIGLNPLHALFLSKPDQCSPFSPSNRRFLNPLYLAVDRVAGFAPGMADPDAIAALRTAELVDCPGVAALKLAVLDRIWQAAGRPDAPQDVLDQGGADLIRHALFEAISARMVAQGHGAGWRDWPDDWQDAQGAAVAGFAMDHADAPRFHRWLQGLAQGQLAQARDACGRAGMSIGLYLDFAVGEAADGSGSWGNPMVVPGIRIGAPPDMFNETGQDWGLAPLSPVAMAADHARPFAGLMAQATQAAGALRIDHAMGLWQLFLIPDGAGPADGTYARYPLPDMLDGLATASVRNRTIIIGEDLGNVPPGFRQVMDQAGILSYRIVMFERDADGFIAPADYPRNALACLSTHDLPTFQGWWRGDDIARRLEHDLIGDAGARRQTDSRRVERADLLAALGMDDPGLGPAPQDLVAAVHGHWATAPSRLFAVRLEDICGQTDPVNIPSTTDAYPNWRTKLDVTVGDIDALPLWGAIATALRAARPRGQSNR